MTTDPTPVPGVYVRDDVESRPVPAELALEAAAEPDPALAAAERATEQGRQAALTGAPWSSNPYARPPVPFLRSAWRRGYEAGELEQGDRDGDLFRGTAR